MRVLTLLVLGSATVLLAAAPAHARKKSTPTPAASAPTESAAERAARLALADDTGSLRENQLAGVELNTMSPPESESTAERTAAAPTRPDRLKPLSSAMGELIDKRMSQSPQFTAQLDRCVATAKARSPQLRGSLAVEVQVTGKSASVALADPTHVPDAQLGSCVAAVRGRLSLPDLRFPWQLSLN